MSGLGIHKHMRAAHTSNYLALVELLPQLPLTNLASKSEIIYFASNF